MSIQSVIDSVSSLSKEHIENINKESIIQLGLGTRLDNSKQYLYTTLDGIKEQVNRMEEPTGLIYCFRLDGDTPKIERFAIIKREALETLYNEKD